jgi:predicted  nucleic acid-binding Zn-ribbon protein
MNEQEYSLVKSLKGKYGQIVPCLADANGEVFDGLHRKEIDPDAETIRRDNIKSAVDRTFARMIANKVRRQYQADELSKDIAFLLGSGFSIHDIEEITGISERTLIKHKPTEMKDEVKVEAGLTPKSYDIAEAFQKAAQPEGERTAIPPSMQEQIASELRNCEKCGQQFHRSKATIQGGLIICPKCAGKDKPIPATKTEVKEYKPKESWTQRKAIMQPQVSKQEIAALEELQRRGHKVESQVRVCLVETVIDYIVDDVPFYLDGKYAHLNRDWKDDLIREKLSQKLGKPVYAVEYERFSQKSTKEIVDQMEEALRWKQ